MNKKYLLKDNKGFSLVELIVVVLITGVLMLAVMLFVQTSRSVYQTVNTSATLQEEAITVERVLSEYIMEAKECGYEEGVKIEDGKFMDIFWVRALENEKNGAEDAVKPYSVYCFILDKDNEKMFYYKDLREEKGVVVGNSLSTSAASELKSSCTGDTSKYYLIGNHINYMKPTKYSRADGSELICLNLNYTYLGKDYTSTVTAVTRNKNYVATDDDEDEDEDGEDGTDT